MPATTVNAAHTYYVCYNQLTYLVACEHVLSAGSASRATILVAPERVTPQPRYTAVLHRPLSRRQLLIAWLRCVFAGPRVVYIPHHNTRRLVRMLASAAASTRLVDDGLDTLRDRPHHIDINELPKIDELLTFQDYTELPRWTERVAVKRVCALEILLQDVRPALPTAALKAVIVESPGVDMTRLDALTRARPDEMFVFVHGNPNKRTPLPAALRRSQPDAYSIERTIVGFEGDVVAGETMVSVFVAHCARKSRLILQLSRPQYDNLACLHARFRAAQAVLDLAP